MNATLIKPALSDPAFWSSMADVWRAREEVAREELLDCLVRRDCAVLIEAGLMTTSEACAEKVAVMTIGGVVWCEGTEL